MAKKSGSGRTKSRAAAKKTPTVEPAAPPVEVAPVESAPETQAPPRTAKVRRAQATGERLEDEYGYIVGDLRRVLLLAAAMFALLIAVNVILGMLR